MRDEFRQVVRRTRRLLEEMQQSGITTIPHTTKERRLAPIKEAAFVCTKCRLCQGRTHVVFGEGSLDAKIVFVGEGPGQEEDRKGRPFVGAAGRVLTQLIGQLGLKREAVYIANVVKCRPPNNRPPQPDEIAACLPYLKAQLTTIHPHVICALGRTAANALLSTQTPMGELRGKRFEWEGIPLVVTFHPAYLLRNPSAMPLIRQDMRTLLTFVGKGEAR